MDYISQGSGPIARECSPHPVFDCPEGALWDVKRVGLLRVGNLRKDEMPQELLIQYHFSIESVRGP